MTFKEYLDNQFLVDFNKWFVVDEYCDVDTICQASLRNEQRSQQYPFHEARQAPSFGVYNFYFAAILYLILAFQRAIHVQGANALCNTLLFDLGKHSPYPIFKELHGGSTIASIMRSANLILVDEREREKYANSLTIAADVFYPRVEEFLKSKPLPIFNSNPELCGAILSDFRNSIFAEIAHKSFFGDSDGVKEYFEQRFFEDFAKCYPAQPGERVILKKLDPQVYSDLFNKGFWKNGDKFATILAFMLAAEYCMQQVFGQECTSLFCSSCGWPYLKCSGERPITSETVDMSTAIALKTREKMKDAGFEHVYMEAWGCESYYTNSERYAPLILGTRLRQILNGSDHITNITACVALRDKIGHKKRAMLHLLDQVLLKMAG